MRTLPGVRRVIIVVLDGLRPDAITRLDLPHLQRLGADGAATYSARTVAPSVTAAAMASLLTGVDPSQHGVISDRFHIPRTTSTLAPLPKTLAAAGYPASAFIRRVPTLFRGIASRIARQLGIGDVRFSGETAPDILLAGRSTLREQRRGLILFHWPDADDAGHEHGWMSDEYAAGARSLDATLGLLVALADIPRDPSTLLIVVADHGGGGALPKDHDSPHPLDRTIPVILAGAAVVGRELRGDITLLDIPATVLWTLGVSLPAMYTGRPLVEAFEAESVAVA